MKNERGIAVAKDVLKRLRELNLRRGYYVVPAAELDVPASCNDLQKVAAKAQKACEVCLLGACLLSKARLYDEVQLDEFLRLGSCSYTVRDLLSDVFDPTSTDLMEAAFEGQVMPWMSHPRRKQLCRAIELGENFADRKECVRAVMNNVIENDGHFVP